MKKFIYMFLSVFTLPINVLAEQTGEDIINDCSGVLGSGVVDVLNWVYSGILVATPILVVILSMKDILTAVTAGKDDEIRKAQSTLIKRFIVGIIIFFIPILIKAILNLSGIIGSC